MNSPHEPTVDDSTQVHREEGWAGTRSRSPRATGHTPVSSTVSHVTHRFLSTPSEPRVSSRFNVCQDSTTFVDSTTSTTRVPILTSKAWNEVWADGFDDQTEQESCAIAKMTAQCALYTGPVKICWTPWLYTVSECRVVGVLTWGFVCSNHYYKQTTPSAESYPDDVKYVSQVWA